MGTSQAKVSSEKSSEQQLSSVFDEWCGKGFFEKTCQQVKASQSRSETHLEALIKRQIVASLFPLFIETMEEKMQLSRKDLRTDNSSKLELELDSLRTAREQVETAFRKLDFQVENLCKLLS